jgi:hypothetical protein
VHAVLTGPTDTEMTRGFEIPKASAESVARAIFDGVESGEEDGARARECGSPGGSLRQGRMSRGESPGDVDARALRRTVKTGRTPALQPSRPNTTIRDGENDHVFRGGRSTVAPVHIAATDSRLHETRDLWGSVAHGQSGTDPAGL